MHLRKTIWTVAGILVIICAGVFFFHIKNKSNVPSPAASVSYLDEKEHSLDLKSVPGSYLKRADKQGKLERIYYETKDYDDDEAEMEKYAVVYTPYGYDAGKKYDVMYMLHGHTGSADTWLGSPEEPNYTKNCLDHLIEEGYVKPIIVVSMTYYDNNEDENTDNYDMQDTSEMFRFGMPGDEGINCAYGIGEGEEHDRHGRTTALYNILPMISDMIYK